jgi:transposase
MLNLDGLEIENTAQTDTRYDFIVRATTPPPPCCLTPPVRNGLKRVKFLDLPMHGRHVAIWADRQRYKCSCGKTLYQPIPHMNDTNMMTQRLVRYIEQMGLENTFASLSRTLGISEATVRGIFRRMAKRELGRLEVKTPEIMGLDEVHILSRFRGVVTNIGQRTLVDILPNRNKPSIIRFLSAIPDKETVKMVAMDMWQPYRDAVHLVLPHAKIVVDKFHVVRMANEAMERIRKAHRLTLTTKSRLQLKDDRWILLRNREKLPALKLMIMETWFDRFPDLKAAYEAKEAFRAIWDAKTKEEAMALYDKWEDELPDSCADAFIDLRIAMRNWRVEIFNHFEARVTNAYTEAMNGITRIVNRAGRGYSFEVLRARLLLNYANQKVEGGGGCYFGKRPVPPWSKPAAGYPYNVGVPLWKFTREKVRGINLGSVSGKVHSSFRSSTQFFA